MWFRLRLELYRRGAVGSLLTILWMALVLGAVGLALSKVSLTHLDALAAVLGGAGVLLAGVTHFLDAIANPFQRAIDRHARRPDYEAHLGFTAEADRDIRVLTRLLAPSEDDGLAIFVDDLDRCSSAHLVEVVEAMNQIFNSSRKHHCAFILGLDRDIVATNINVAYAGTVAALGDGQRSHLAKRFGHEFLAKLVQLSVAIPEPSKDALVRLLEAVTDGGAGAQSAIGTDIGVAATVAAPAEIAQAREEIQASAGASLFRVASAAAQLSSGSEQARAEAQRLEVAERLEDSPEVAAAERAAVPFLERNPRALKRFHNAFRLQLYVANEDPSVPFEFSEAELVALAKWVIVRLRWPELGNSVARDPALLLVIEAEANHEPSAISADLITDARIAQRDEWMKEPGVRELMSEKVRERRVSGLEVKAFLRVA